MCKFKQLFSISILSIISLFSNGYSQNNSDLSIKSEDKIYNLADLDVSPNYIGGVEAFYKFVSDNFNLPDSKVSSGKIQVALIVEKDGSLSDIKAVEDFGYNSGNELVRVLSKSPKWIPAQKNNENVRCKVNFPITILLKPNQETKEVEKEEDEIYYAYSLDEKAEFPGGIDVLEATFKNNFRIPEGFEPVGEIIVNLIVEKNGSTTINNIKSEIENGTEQETKRIIGQLPKWKPAKIGNESVKSHCRIILNFDERQRLTISNKKELSKKFKIPNLATRNVTKQPQFIGGMEQFYRYVGMNFNYPENSNFRPGKIVTTFVVETDGSISNINVIEDLGFGTFFEITRLLEKCPKWNPGEINGVPVRTQFVLPVIIQ